MFPYEKLEVYWLAVEFEEIAERIVEQIRPRAPKLAGQVETEADSITLNICEGATYYWPSEKAKYYRYARGSANEASGAIGRALRRGLISPEVAKEAISLLKRISVMLFNLIQRMEQEAINGRGKRPQSPRDVKNKSNPKRPKPHTPPADATNAPNAPSPDATNSPFSRPPDAPDAPA